MFMIRDLSPAEPWGKTSAIDDAAVADLDDGDDHDPIIDARDHAVVTDPILPLPLEPLALQSVAQCSGIVGRRNPVSQESQDAIAFRRMNLVE
nr:hypothetical protein [Brevundimonas sp.]